MSVHCGMTWDWTRSGCSHPVSRPGFISSFSTVFSTAHLPENAERKLASQTDSQLDRKWSSKGVRGCLGWFMPSSGMLNELRVHVWEPTEQTVLTFLVTFSYSLNGNSQNGKMWPYCPILILHGTSNTRGGRLKRKWITVRPQSEFLVSALTASAQRQSWATCWRLVAKQKWKTLICITALLKYWTTQSRSFSELHLHLIWLSACASVAIRMDRRSLRHQEITIIFWVALIHPVSVWLSASLFLSLSKCCLWSLI